MLIKEFDKNVLRAVYSSVGYKFKDHKNQLVKYYKLFLFIWLPIYEY